MYPVFYFVAYVALFAAGCLGLFFWHLRRSRTRSPVEFKLLRGPGESLRKKIAELDENDAPRLLMWAAAPLIALGCASWVLFQFTKLETWPQFWWRAAIVLSLSGCVLALGIRRTARGFFIRRNYQLGYLGERFVAEKIAPLEREGYRVFHDVPAEAGLREFNLDHVIVGPGGIWLIETKTRRKGRTRPGHKDNVVTFDGSRLVWPWGEDEHGLAQAEAQARWLEDWVKRKTGLTEPVRPVLALPGWWVNENVIGPVRVQNPLNIAGLVRRARAPRLTEAQIDLIARQLDDLCRDVESH